MQPQPSVVSYWGNRGGEKLEPADENRDPLWRPLGSSRLGHRLGLTASALNIN